MKKCQKNINLYGKEISYILRSSRRAKRVIISVGCDGLVVAKPSWVSEKSALRFIIEKARWILEKLEEAPAGLSKEEKIGEYKKHKEAARELIKKRIEQLNLPYNFFWGKIAIRKQKTRWGSCSASGNLNFNYKIIFLPQVLADYIIVHELCHLKELNHSSRFWTLVARTFPNYQVLRRELRKWNLN